MPLEIVFNNFHMNLLTRDTLVGLVGRAGGLSVEVHDDYHPSFASPLYLDAVLRFGPAPTTGRALRWSRATTTRTTTAPG